MTTSIIILTLSITLIFAILIYIIVKRSSNHNIGSIKALVKQGKSGIAIDILKKILVKDPQNVDAHFLLAQAFMLENKAELAFMEIKSINKIGEFSPACPEKEFRQLSSKLFLQFGQPDEALKDYLLLIKLDPSDPENYYNIGLLFEARRKPDKAVNYYKKTIGLDRRHSGSYMHLGMIMYNNKRFKDAKTFFDSSLMYDDSNFETYFYLGKIAKETKDYIGAIALFEKALREKSVKLKSLMERGTCFIALKKYRTAITELDKALTLIRNNPDAKSVEPQFLFTNYFIAMAYEMERDLDKAIEHWQAINTRKKNFKDVSEKLSQYKELQENDKMKDFLTSSNEDFIEICKEICTKMNYVAQDVKEIKDGLQIIGLESGKKDWKAAKKLPYLIRMLRVSMPVSESDVRSILDEMKNLGISKSILVSSSDISIDGKKYAESRPLELIDKRKFTKIISST